LATAELFYSQKRLFLSAKEIISIGERTLGTRLKKKKLATAQLFYSRKRLFSKKSKLEFEKKQADLRLDYNHKAKRLHNNETEADNSTCVIC